MKGATQTVALLLSRDARYSIPHSCISTTPALERAVRFELTKVCLEGSHLWPLSQTRKSKDRPGPIPGSTSMVAVTLHWLRELDLNQRSPTYEAGEENQTPLSRN